MRASVAKVINFFFTNGGGRTVSDQPPQYADVKPRRAKKNWADLTPRERRKARHTMLLANRVMKQDMREKRAERRAALAASGST